MDRRDREIAPTGPHISVWRAPCFVLDGNDVQHCPECLLGNELRLVAVRPHAVILCCRCSRAWTYPTLTYRWAIDNWDRMRSSTPARTWPEGAPIPADILADHPGLDRVVASIDAIVAAGGVDSHRRMSDGELAALRAREDVDWLPAVSDTVYT